MAVTVTLAVQVGSDDFVHEPELAAIDPILVRGRDPLFGQVVIEAEGQPRLVLHDDLEELVSSLFRAILQLVQREPVTIWYTDSPAEFRMEPVGPSIRITGTVLPPFEAPSAELLPALHAGGGALHRVRPDGADRPGGVPGTMPRPRAVGGRGRRGTPGPGGRYRR